MTRADALLMARLWRFNQNEVSARHYMLTNRLWDRSAGFFAQSTGAGESGGSSSSRIMTAMR